MKLKKLKKKIERRKKLINLLLLFLPPTNKLMVHLSQDLDTYIVKYQKYLLKLHHKPESVKFYYYNIAA